MTPVVCARGERVALGPLRRDLLRTHMRWGNDLPTMRNLGAWGVATAENNLAWLASHDDPARTDLREFLVYELVDWRPLGVTTLHHLDQRNGTAELAIAVAEPDARGRGLGTEAARLTRRARLRRPRAAQYPAALLHVQSRQWARGREARLPRDRAAA